LFIVEDKAISFKNQPWPQIFKKLKDKIPNSTFILIKTGDFQDILDFTQLIKIQQGGIVEKGSPKHLLLDSNSAISKFMRVNDIANFSNVVYQLNNMKKYDTVSSGFEM
jgi:hypothetical protein